MLGIKIGSLSGNFQVPIKWYLICKGLPDANPAEVIIAILSLVFLVVMKEVVNERFKHKLKVPIPAELILVIVAIIVSHFAKLHQRQVFKLHFYHNI